MARGVENGVDGRRGLAALGDDFSDPPVFDDEAALGAFREYGEGVLDPGAHCRSASRERARRAVRDEVAAEGLSRREWACKRSHAA